MINIRVEPNNKLVIEINLKNITSYYEIIQVMLTIDEDEKFSFILTKAQINYYFFQIRY